MQQILLIPVLTVMCAVYTDAQSYAPAPRVVVVTPLGTTSVPLTPATPVTLQLPPPTVNAPTYLDTRTLPPTVHVVELANDGSGGGGRRYTLTVDDGGLPSGEAIEVQRVEGTEMVQAVVVTAPPSPDGAGERGDRSDETPKPEASPTPTLTPPPIPTPVHSPTPLTTKYTPPPPGGLIDRIADFFDSIGLVPLLGMLAVVMVLIVVVSRRRT